MIISQLSCGNQRPDLLSVSLPCAVGTGRISLINKHSSYTVCVNRLCHCSVHTHLKRKRKTTQIEIPERDMILEGEREMYLMYMWYMYLIFLPHDTSRQTLLNYYQWRISVRDKNRPCKKVSLPLWSNL